MHGSAGYVDRWVFGGTLCSYVGLNSYLQLMQGLIDTAEDIILETSLLVLHDEYTYHFLHILVVASLSFATF
jgi:hypothetical protein